jgi:hypothetical protein
MSADQSPHLSLDYLVADQAQKHVTVNQALRRLDGLAHLAVISRKLAIPPSAPSNGARYLIPENSQDLWAGRAGQIAIYEDTAWAFLRPQIGWRVWQSDEKHLLAYDGASWVELGGAQGLDVRLTRASQTCDVSQDLPLFSIPSHALFFGITGLVTQAITGPSHWQLGTADGLNRFGSDLATARGTAIHGPANPPSVYWRQTPVVLTPEGGAFRVGEVKLDMFYLTLPLPGS